MVNPQWDESQSDDPTPRPAHVVAMVMMERLLIVECCLMESPPVELDPSQLGTWFEEVWRHLRHEAALRGCVVWRQSDGSCSIVRLARVQSHRDRFH